MKQLSTEEKARLYDKMNEPPPYTPPPPKKANNWVFVIVPCLGLIIYLFSPSEKSAPSGSSMTSNNKFLAYSYAEDFVKKQLKSPSTAKFPGTFEKNEHITELGASRYKIVSWVDSQNGFGAMIRTNFSCIIQFEGDNVRCLELRFE